MGLLEKIPHMDLGNLLWLARESQRPRWEYNAAVYRALAQYLLERGAVLAALDLTGDGVRRHPADIALRRVHGLALARHGNDRMANRVLRTLVEEGHHDPETLGPLAGTCKRLAEKAGDPAARTAFLRDAHRLYLDAHERAARSGDVDGALYAGINAASTACLLGDGQVADRLARAVRNWCQQRLARGPDFWAEASLGEAALVSSEWAMAAHHYERAARIEGGNIGNQVVARRQARRLLAHLGRDPKELDPCFRIGQVAVFAGHMIDRPDRRTPRFPAALESAVAAAIREHLDRLDIRIGFSSAACGSDILFLEALIARDGEANIILPCEEAQFRARSVNIIPGADWGVRFDRVLEKAARREVVCHQQVPSPGATSGRPNYAVYWQALLHAQRLDTRLIHLAVWDSRSEDPASGTAAAVQIWREFTPEVEIIDLAVLRQSRVVLPDRKVEVAAPRGSDSQATGSPQEVKALLFVEPVGSGALASERASLVAQQFIEGISRVLAHADAGTPPYAPRLKLAWGSGLHFVFSTTREAGRFALALRDFAAGIDWSARGLPDGLGFRIALHAAPVHTFSNPVTGELYSTGPLVSRAAILEAVTPAGFVHASEAFAATATAQGVTEFVCQPVEEGESTVGVLYHVRWPKEEES